MWSWLTCCCGTCSHVGFSWSSSPIGENTAKIINALFNQVWLFSVFFLEIIGLKAPAWQQAPVLCWVVQATAKRHRRVWHWGCCPLAWWDLCEEHQLMGMSARRLLCGLIMLVTTYEGYCFVLVVTLGLACIALCCVLWQDFKWMPRFLCRVENEW